QFECFRPERPPHQRPRQLRPAITHRDPRRAHKYRVSASPSCLCQPKQQHQIPVRACPRQYFTTTGISASRPSPTSAAISRGVSTSPGSKAMWQLDPLAAMHSWYKFFCAVITLSKPVPAKAKTTAPGIIPSAVAATNGPSHTQEKAGKRLTRKKGNTGTGQKNRR